jgi:hypothetical protein
MRQTALGVVVSAVLGCGGGESGDADAGATRDASPPDAAGFDAGPLEPAVGDALTGLELFDGWSDPRALAGDVNTTGWEDSSFIAPGGRTLYFGYTRWDHDELTDGSPSIVITGPERTGQQGDAFDIWEAALDDSGWHLTNSTANVSGDIPEAAQGVDRTETEMVFARFVGPGELYWTTRPSRADAWDAPAALPAPFASACVEDNPHITADGQLLFFDSDRADATATTCKDPGQPRDLYVAARDGSGWTAPVLVAGTPNTGLTRFQPFATADGGTLYWSGANADDCTTSFSCVYRAERQVDDSYGTTTLVARAANPMGNAADGDVIALGEVSITEDGQWMYFTYLQRVDVTTTDLSIGVARRE